MDTAAQSQQLRNIRWLLSFFIAGLFLSGITAFPLVQELDLLCSLAGVGDVRSPAGHTGLVWWLLRVREGLHAASVQYPFLAYGTDWLAFGHIIIALFFIGPWIDPVRNVWVLRVGLFACAAVIPLALICGPIRGIPFYWRLIDCSFGVFGAIPLLLVLRLTKQLARSGSSS